MVRGTGELLVNGCALDQLQALCDPLGNPVIVRSAYRSLEHTHAVSPDTVGGVTRSKNMDGAAFGISMASHEPGDLRGVGAGGRVPRFLRARSLITF